MCSRRWTTWANTGVVSAFEAQDERPALSGTMAELDHFGEPESVAEPDRPALTRKSLPTTA